MRTMIGVVGSISRWAGIALLSILYTAPARADHGSGYPEQERISFGSSAVDRMDLRTSISPAMPAMVNRSFGREFASLHRMGVLLVLVINKTRETPIAIARQSVQLTLRDARVLKPLSLPEMIGWLETAYGPGVEKPAFLGKESNMGFEDGVLRVPKGSAQGAMLVFQFPEGITSGTFDVDYSVDLGEGEKISVKQQPRLNLQP